MRGVSAYWDGTVYGYHIPAEVTVYLDPKESYYCVWVHIGDTEIKCMINGQVGEAWRTWFLDKTETDLNPTASAAPSSPSGSSGSSG